MSGPGLCVFQQGLLGPMARQARDLVAGHADLTPLLRLARYGDHVPAPVRTPGGAEAQLCALWGLPVPQGEDSPVGAIAARGDGVAPGDGEVVYRASPVQLVADRDRLLIQGPETLQLQDDESAACLAALNESFAADPLHFHAGVSGNWYLSTSSRPRLRTTPLDQAEGRSMADVLPVGDDARQWIARLNEIQMLLFSLPLNRLREQRGLPLVNGLWFWGGGVPPTRISRHWQVATGFSPLHRGLAGLAGVDWNQLPQAGEPSSPSCEGLLELPPLPAVTDGVSLERWEQGLNQTCRHWIGPLLGRVERGELGELRLETGQGGGWIYRPGYRWRVWRRPVGLRRLIAVGEP
ncbi:MAG: hypothetical protein JJU06_20360 [Ectothiorhodospiraceae bacterium]|nr:hypothetical protein [Ectothiorhodospiraceae bacterium]MCH8505424.1 hypothetical protein [Ectothiorhodospiraceae bacterium]